MFHFWKLICYISFGTNFFSCYTLMNIFIFQPWKWSENNKTISKCYIETHFFKMKHNRGVCKSVTKIEILPMWNIKTYFFLSETLIFLMLHFGKKINFISFMSISNRKNENDRSIRIENLKPSSSINSSYFSRYIIETKTLKALKVIY